MLIEGEEHLALIENTAQTHSFLKSLGFPDLQIHHAILTQVYVKSETDRPYKNG